MTGISKLDGEKEKGSTRDDGEESKATSTTATSRFDCGKTPERGTGGDEGSRATTLMVEQGTRRRRRAVQGREGEVRDAVLAT